jgi:predicted acetyltransferase
MSAHTSDPWTATDAASDPLRHALHLARLNESARGGRRMGDEVRSVVDRSWQRSAAAGVDPEATRPRAVLGRDVLERRRASHPLAVVRPTLARVLTDLTSSAPHVFALSDARGVLLWVDGSEEVVERAGGEMAFEAGSDWSERAAGTNAVGTALVEEHAVQIFSAEHFRPAVHGWTCSASPIRCPETGEILGVLDATADLRTVDPRTLPYLVGATRAAERVLRGRAERRDQRLRALVRQRPAGAPRPELALSPLGRVVALDGGAPGPAEDAADGRRWRLPRPSADGGPIRLPDGTTVPRLPGYVRWMWDGEFCGSIGFRWQPGTEALPAYCPGHIGYAVVPWKQRRGYATLALREMLKEAKAVGLRYVEITTDADNLPSQRVILANNGVLVEQFDKPPALGGHIGFRYRVSTGGS